MTTPHPYGTPQAKRLEARFSEFRSRYDNSPYANLMLRMRRITSWLTRAEQELFEREPPDPDAAFIFYWMAFNAAYGEKGPDKNEDWMLFNDYLGRLLFYDNKENVIYNALRNSVSRDVVLSFIDNQYLYWRFGDTTTASAGITIGDATSRQKTRKFAPHWIGLSPEEKYCRGVLRTTDGSCWKSCLAECICFATK